MGSNTQNSTLINRRICILSVFITVLIMMMLNVPACQDPHDFEPPEDSLLPPPDPPTLLAPENGFVYMYEEPPFYIVTIFEWTPVEGAEYYHIDYVVDTFPPTMIMSTGTICTLITDDTTNRQCDHFWRVRAGAQTWEWFTEWSGQRWFEIRRRPDGPTLLSPVDSTLIATDTFPYLVELKWHSIQDEEFYEVCICKNDQYYEQSYVYDTSYALYCMEHGEYSWQVRAGSLMWEYYSLWSTLWHFSLTGSGSKFKIQ